MFVWIVRILVENLLGDKMSDINYLIEAASTFPAIFTSPID